MKKESAAKPADGLMPTETIAGHIDPMGVFLPALNAQAAWLLHPKELAESLAGFSTRLFSLYNHTMLRAAGLASEEPAAANPDDTRFSDPIWTESAGWDAVKEWYLLLTREIQDWLYAAPGLSDAERRRAAFWSREWLNALAPTNFLLSNPVAMRKALESNGESLQRGIDNWLADFRAGTVRMTSPDDFKVGENLATTPGKVVFRNRLLEVIHYTPSQPKVHAVPLVIITPWINKFYILDLNARKSLIRFLVEHQYDVYITSWRNPPAELRDVGFDDYLQEGVAATIDAARDISGAKQVNLVGYCIGGAAVATYMAWANRHYPPAKQPAASATFFTTLVDYQHPGDVEVFLDESSVRWLSSSMARKGYLDGQEMATAFRLLRSNSLIWHYVVQGYLYGESPPPFDVLYWNMDTTRMPAAMHAWYLREFYLNNGLVKKDALTVAGEPIDLGRIAQPIYAVSAVDDHIAPWRQTFRINNLVAGDRRYVLSSSGHILGIVNPPVNPPKRDYWVADVERHETADTWKERAEHRPGSWWDDWLNWLEPKAGKLKAPPPAGSATYPVLGDAPGMYVLEK